MINKAPEVDEVTGVHRRRGSSQTKSEEMLIVEGESSTNAPNSIDEKNTKNEVEAVVNAAGNGQT